MSLSWLAKSFGLPMHTKERPSFNQKNSLDRNSNKFANILDDIYVDEVSEADLQVVIINKHPDSNALTESLIEYDKTHGTLNRLTSTSKNFASSGVMTEYRLNKFALAERLLFWIDVPQARNASTRGGLGYFNFNDCEQYIYEDDSRIKKWEKIKDMVMKVEVFGASLPEQGEPWH